MNFTKLLIILYLFFLTISLTLFFIDNVKYSYLIIIVVTLFFWILHYEYKKAIKLFEIKNKHILNAERNLRFTIDNFPFLVWLKDTKGRFITVNKPFVKSCFKEDISEIEGKTDLDLWPQELAESYRLDDESVMKNHQQKIVKEKISIKGKEGWFETYKSPVYNPKGELSGTVGFAMDISDREKYENELKLTSIVFNSSYDGIVITDNKTRILKVNNTFTNITGYTQDEVYYKKTNILSSNKTSKEFFKKMWKELNTNGHWSGKIWNKNKRGELYLEWLTIKAVYDKDNNIKNYIGIFTDISLIKENKNKLNFLAYHDVLTGLGNRELLSEQFPEYLKISQEKDMIIATFFIDLDGFKEVNDQYGHDVGDSLLQIVSKRMLNITREEDLVIRLGGDEFVIIVLEDKNNKQIYKTLANKLLNKIAEPYEIKEHLINISASIGISFYPEQGQDLTKLLQYADNAMYKAKQKGKNQFQKY